MKSKIVGNGVLVVGDLHISDIYTGKHKSYLEECFYVLRLIVDKVNELKPAALVILGDIVGVREKNIKHREVLSMLCKFFKDVNKVCTVYCVRGNHDFGDFPDFQFLSELNLFETSTSTNGYFDFYGESDAEFPEVRFHIVDYGSENRELELSGDNTTDIVLAHNNFTIQGLTNWYQQHDGIELSMQSNFKGVYMVVSGHIHAPSPEIISTDMACGGECNLFYTGCPTRPAERYDDCWFIYFNYNKEFKSTDYDAIPFNLQPSSEVFFDDDDYIEDEEDTVEIERTEALKDVLEDIMKCRMTSGDLVAQVRAIPHASDKAKECACNYLQAALDNH